MSEEKIITAEDILKAVKTIGTEPFNDEDKRVILRGEDYVALVYRIDEQNKIIEKQKAEIERLTEERDTAGYKNNTLIFDKSNLQAKKAKLQRQVEVLTAEKENLYFINKNLEDYIDNHEPIWKRNTEQAEKETARKILGELDLFFKGTTFRQGYEFNKIMKKLKEMAKNYDVGVDYEN